MSLVPSSSDVHVIVELTSQGGVTVDRVFSLSTSLWEVLHTFQPLHPHLHLQPYKGTPPPETNARYAVHINVPGRMQPVIQSGDRRFTATSELKRTPLSSLTPLSPSSPSSPTSLLLRLSFAYQKPEMSEAKQAEVMSRFTRTFHASVADVDRGVKARLDRERKADEAVSTVSIPSDRRRRLYRAPVGPLPTPDLPDSFYEVTEEDSLAHARAITQQAAIERGEKVEAKRRRPLPHVAVVRVRLPGHLYLEGLFRATEAQEAVVEWVKGCMREEVRDGWELIVSPPRRVVKGQRTLREDGLVGHVMMHLRQRDEGGVRRGRETPLREEKKDGEEAEEKGGAEENKAEAEVSSARPEEGREERAEVTGEQLLREDVLTTLVELPVPALAAQEGGAGVAANAVAEKSSG